MPERFIKQRLHPGLVAISGGIVLVMAFIALFDGETFNAYLQENIVAGLIARLLMAGAGVVVCWNALTTLEKGD